MNEHTAHPRSAYRHPRALFGRVQIYAQNNPRAYAVRAVLIGFPLFMLPPLLFCVLLIGEWRLLLPLLLGLVVPMVVMGALMILLMPKLMRKTLGTSTLASDTDPVDLLEAKRQLRRGGLHEREEVNRVARVLAAQAEAKVNSPKFVNAMGLLGAAVFAPIAALTYVTSGFGFDFWFRAVFALAFLSYPVLLGPWVKRYRERARDFAGLYDNRRIADEAERYLVGSG